MTTTTITTHLPSTTRTRTVASDERPSLPVRVAAAALAYIGTAMLAIIANGDTAGRDVRTAGYFPR